ncbi:large conductance mechanosensitive channel protein MscL [Acidithiobacillus sp. CV18-2]|uniref:Large-conductance mechanosensitive channel n=1 Tax=Igneacidithiobacillus copahuensis TaxID=2724909 RepID=A0AAE2YNG9_9PROT|nr:large conductance mechanosensitive channel protein MscL [Igneacidithiobacillus copahuensis]MBU2753821.1 large conductance mechanosensitive channel protein MscL [Acidithiobacillus sp. CV18-3]MBU2756481.1 large conductance mechanosensitive channel protein MscL [Acidithiobacillus sp. BN09-2]MBU2776416.1 large conductance mechanosensitive channel protein MscL [Acidithiobacillus sp. CV18-2]MBU2796319.1 large conductance mechanosensitive channel protein MscL [Acidithiobacillus sp. VAN18-2]MBU2799
MSQFFKDFKIFLQRGNVIDLAVAFVVGSAFSAIVTSLVKNIVMPPIGLVLGKVDFSNLFLVLHEGKTPGPYLTLAAAEKAGAVTWNYGLFIMSIISFLIIAFVIFLLVHTINRLYPKPVAPVTTKDCPFCATAIPLAASRCPNCTSQLSG